MAWALCLALFLAAAVPVDAAGGRSLLPPQCSTLEKQHGAEVVGRGWMPTGMQSGASREISDTLTAVTVSR